MNFLSNEIDYLNARLEYWKEQHNDAITQRHTFNKLQSKKAIRRIKSSIKILERKC